MAEEDKQRAVATETKPEDFMAAVDRELPSSYSEDQRGVVESYLKTFVDETLASHEEHRVPANVTKFIEQMIARIDAKLSEQLTEILHEEKFRKLEGSWRGLAYLVKNTETDSTLKIRVMNVSKNDLRKELEKYEGTAKDQSAFWKSIFEKEFDQPGGHPYGAMIGDYEFSQHPQDVAMLRNISHVAAAALCPFFAAASPNLFDMENWTGLPDPRDLKKTFSRPAYASWNSLRKEPDSRYICLTVPRFLSRLPYGEATEPIEAFAYEEDTAMEGKKSGEGKPDHDKFVWSNAAYAMGMCVTRAFKNYHWCAQIYGPNAGGKVDKLPVYTFSTADGKEDMKCPTEIAISQRRAKELADLGLLPLCHWKGTDHSSFLSAESLQEPIEYDDPDATANAKLAARVNYLFAACRFGHYVKHMCLEWVGQFTTRDQLQARLERWIQRYVVDSSASDAIKAQKPLSEAEIIVEDIEGDPGNYYARVYLKPHYQLVGLTASMRLTTKVPSKKGS